MIRTIPNFITILFLLVHSGCAGSSSSSSSNGNSTLSTWIGDGTQGFDGDGENLTESWLNQPMELVFGPNGEALIADWNNHRIRQVTSDETLTTLIGTTLPGDWPCQDPDDPDDCETALAETIAGTELSLNHPMDIVFRSDGIAYIAAWHNHKIEQVDLTDGLVSILAGTQSPGFTGDGGPSADAKLNFPSSLVLDVDENLFVSDERNNRIRRIANDEERTITTVAGSSSPPATSDYDGDGGPAASAKLALTAYDEEGGSDNPPPGGGLAMDDNGSLYIADTFNHCVRKIIPGTDSLIGEGDASEETISTIAGICETSGYTGDGGVATEATFNEPFDLDFGPDGRLYVADTGNHVIRAVDLSTGIVETVVGTGEEGFAGDGSSPLEAELQEPYGIAFDDDGNLYIVDTLNNRIRVVED